MENILLDEKGDIKIIDFGLSNVVQSCNGDISRPLVTQCGSPAYAAPELLAKQSYGPKVDVWSIGVITFSLIVGKLPFSVEPFNLLSLRKKMMKGNMNPVPKFVSPTCRSFIEKLLDPDQDRRPSITEVKDMEWLNQRDLPNANFSFDRSKISVDPKQEISCLPPHVDAMVLKEMKDSFDYEYADVVRCVQRNRPGSILATYHLIKRRNSSISNAVSFSLNKSSAIKRIVQQPKCADPITKVHVQTNKLNAITKQVSKCQNKNPVNDKEDTKLLTKQHRLQVIKYFEFSSDQADETNGEKPAKRKLNYFPSNKDGNVRKNLSQISAELKEKLSKNCLIIRESNSENASDENNKTSLAFIFPKPKIQNKNFATNRQLTQQNSQCNKALTKTCSTTKQQNTNNVATTRGNQVIACKIQQNHPLERKYNQSATKQNYQATQETFLCKITSHQKLRKPISTEHVRVSFNFQNDCVKNPVSNHQLSIPHINDDSGSTQLPGRVKQQIQSLEELEKQKSPVKSFLPPVKGCTYTNNKERRERDITKHQVKKISRRHENACLPPVLLSRRWQKLYLDKPTSFESKYNPSGIKNCSKNVIPIKTKPKKGISEPIATAISYLVSTKQPARKN